MSKSSRRTVSATPRRDSKRDKRQMMEARKAARRAKHTVQGRTSR